MLYVDYNWDLTPTTIMPDPELDTDKLDWKMGDFFRFKNTTEKNIYAE